MKTKIINIKDGEEYDVYIGRGSKWGNPFRIGKDGNRESVIAKYREYILKNAMLMDNLKELEGKILACYCKPLSCHGDILIELIEKI